MFEVELRTEKGELVTVVLIPPFLTPPDVIVWGTRHFKKGCWSDPSEGSRPYYNECFAVAAIWEAKRTHG